MKFNIPVLSLKIIEFELREHVYSLPDGTVTQEGYGKEVVKPDQKDWHIFINKMSSVAGIKEEWNEYNILDGTSWEFYFKFQNHTIDYRGSNLWSPEYRLILEALKKLTNIRRLHFNPFNH